MALAPAPWRSWRADAGHPTAGAGNCQRCAPGRSGRLPRPALRCGRAALPPSDVHGPRTPPRSGHQSGSPDSARSSAPGKSWRCVVRVFRARRRRAKSTGHALRTRCDRRPAAPWRATNPSAPTHTSTCRSPTRPPHTGSALHAIRTRRFRPRSAGPRQAEAPVSGSPPTTCSQPPWGSSCSTDIHVAARRVTRPARCHPCDGRTRRT